MRTHVVVIGALAVLSIGYTWPVFLHPTQTIPGTAGEHVIFYWDIWRTQHAVEMGENPLVTDRMFYPRGQSMVFHTHAILHAILLYPLRHWLNLAGTYNLWAFGSFV